MGIAIVGLSTLPEVRQGDELAALIRNAATAEGHNIDAATIVVIAQKIISKSEGATQDLRQVEPSALARTWAKASGKDPRLIEVALQQSRRIVKMDRGVLIAETHHGFVTANAGVDQSNVPGAEIVTLLPQDPDASADRLRAQLNAGAVIISDTFGRPWREGLVNVAIGASGLSPLEDHRGRHDHTGKPLNSTIVATADEIAAAAGLAMRKSDRIPVALLTGITWTPSKSKASALIRNPSHDLFR